MEEEIDAEGWGGGGSQSTFLSRTRLQKLSRTDHKFYFFFVFLLFFFRPTKATNAELTTQLRRSGANNADPSPQPTTTTTKNNDDSSERRALLARALGAERRLQNAQGQLAATESLVDAINGKTGEANAKWEARVREYENLLKRAEERYKKERQGSKEAVRDMDGTIKWVSLPSVIASGRC